MENRNSLTQIVSTKYQSLNVRGAKLLKSKIVEPESGEIYRIEEELNKIFGT